MTQVFDWDGGVTTYAYDAAGRLSTTTLPNGVQTTNSYDDANRITGLRHVDTNTGLLQADYLYELDGLGNRQVATETLRLPDSGGGGLQTTFITYSYDPLYRLTGASHTGGITATYSYIYDSVGNMTAYTETVGTETSSVNRVFDDANQLLVATDTELGTTSFYYDGNGNLVQIMPPGASGQNLVGTLRYGYNQRNLLITNTLFISDTGWVEQAAFTYDGDGNRVQQVDASGSQPITTTYTQAIADNTGLSQVLVASTGITTTHYLMGLDLISQDDGLETRVLLADGLGSVRTELVGVTIQTVTTYEPFGKLLAQTGSSGTVYGFAGEQHDSATSLIYLRTRYYNVSLRLFMSKDKWPGNLSRPYTFHPYMYAGQNPANWIDPSGLLTCEGPQAGCAHWVQNALNRIENVPLLIGRELVQALWTQDRAIQRLQFIVQSGSYLNNDCSNLNPPYTTPSQTPGFLIKFTDIFPWPSNSPGLDMVTRPSSIYIRTKLFKPPNPPSNSSVLLFAHELVHVKQGSFLAASILGEVLSYQTQYSLRPHLDPGSASSQETEADKIDLKDPAIRYDHSRWFKMLQDLERWRQQFPSYEIVPLLPLVNNPFPSPSNAPPDSVPRVPTPPPSNSSPPAGTPVPPTGTSYSTPPSPIGLSSTSRGYPVLL